MPKVLALYAGRAGYLETATGVVRTAIAKSPITGAVRVDADGFPGDEQISPGHGGPDRAICVYPREHYAHWEAQTGGPLPLPAFGETLTSAGVLETDTLIGDAWRIGGALVQVSQPRSPCAKVAARLGLPRVVMDARSLAYTGLHLRVLEPGELRAGDAIERVGRAAHGISVADAVHARFDRVADPGLIEAVLEVRELAEEWRVKTAPRLAQAA
jgi:MOSC domain-containing protein YiiM